MPNVATGREIAKLDTLVNLAEFVVSQNLWGLKYAGFKKVIASPMMNVFNRYAIAAFKDAGVDRCVASYEQNLKFECDYRFAAGYVPYMTFLYCPAREIYGGDCANCKIKNFTYTDGRGKRYSLLRYRLNRCCFTLIGKFTNIRKISGGYVDLRGLTAAEADCVMNEKPCKAGEDIGKSEFRIN
ncbi:peptidase U32 [Acidaminococcus sp. CAG:917]|nr:peptidase U32 [Acidaminococcus sp. CAG:917]